VYYSEQPKLLKEAKPSNKFNELHLNNFYPKLQENKNQKKEKKSEEFESKEEEMDKIYNDY